MKKITILYFLFVFVHNLSFSQVNEKKSAETFKKELTKSDSLRMAAVAHYGNYKIKEFKYDETSKIYYLKITLKKNRHK